MNTVQFGNFPGNFIYLPCRSAHLLERVPVSKDYRPIGNELDTVRWIDFGQ